MNCCDYDCTQGPNCPARKPVTVANAGQRCPGPEPLPATTSWRAYLGYLTAAMLLTFAVMAVSGVTVMLLAHQRKPPPSICPELIAKHQATGLPAHLKIKCKEFLT
jgi:uncharacterized integral membrane protein